MKLIKQLTAGAFLSASLLSPVVMAESGVYEIDPDHTIVTASWSHFGFSNPSAVFDNVSGTIKFNENLPEKSSVMVTIPISDVTTFVAKLNQEFLGSDYFNVDKFPSATFKSERVEDKGDHNYEIYGSLTIKGITKPMTLSAKLNKMGKHPMTERDAVGFEARGELKRSDFGLDKYVPNVSDEVEIHITTEAQVE